MKTVQGGYVYFKIVTCSICQLFKIVIFDFFHSNHFLLHVIFIFHTLVIFVLKNTCNK